MSKLLPLDWVKAVLVGRVDLGSGPTPIVVRDGRIKNMTSVAPTVSMLLEDITSTKSGEDIGNIAEFEFPPYWINTRIPRLLSPIDLQCIKAAGVTFANSAVERVIEERALGDPDKAFDIRKLLERRVGSSLRDCSPGSLDAGLLKSALIAEGLWSQYLEVAIGPDAEIFTKAPVLSSVGWGDYIGIRSNSHWNNPEPEIVLVCNRHGEAVGATLGNDVNLRDIEGRSALLLGKAKDNNASCSIGPFIRLFDKQFTIDDVRSAMVKVEIEGQDNYRLDGESSMTQISRDPLDLIQQAMSEHQYPDGFVLFLGTMFSPTKDRDNPGQGFTHKEGDIVRISSPKLGELLNKVTTSKAAPPWEFGIGNLIRNLVDRGLLPYQGSSMPNQIQKNSTLGVS
jgi:fumarylacetoacetate (FAA) hydrolase family protein